MNDPDSARGLYGKYYVSKRIVSDGYVSWANPGPVFVLAYKKDKHAKAALRAYIESCREEYPVLATDLENELKKYEDQ